MSLPLHTKGAGSTVHRVRSTCGALTFPISLWSLYWFSWIQSCRGNTRGGQVGTVDPKGPPWIHGEEEPFPPCPQNEAHGALLLLNITQSISTTEARETEIHPGERNKMFHMCECSVYVMKTCVFVCVCVCMIVHIFVCVMCMRLHAVGHCIDAASDAVGRFLFAVFKSISVLLFK